jgi:hypothetical protein
MIKENRVSKYILYAMGEIVLVVIGILIALQINNRNEQSRSDAFELQLLKSFEEGLKKDLDDIDYNIQYQKRGINSANTLIELLSSSEQVTNDSLVANLFGDAMTATGFQYSTSAFETLKSRGITSIKNDSLREKIIGVYDAQFNFFLDYEKEYRQEVNRGLTTIFSTRFEDSYNFNINLTDFPGYIKPLNFEALKNDQEFLYYFKSLRNRSLVLVDFQYELLRSKLVDLINNLSSEIERIEKS